MGWKKFIRKAGRIGGDFFSLGGYEAVRNSGWKIGDMATAGYTAQMRDARDSQKEMIRQQKEMNEQQLALARAQAAQTPEATQATNQDALGKLLKKRTALQRSIATRGAGQKLGD